MISVLIVDDERIIQESLKLLLKEVSGIKIIGEASSGEQAFRLVREKKPDVVLLDIQLPDVSGLHIAQKLLQQYPEIKIIVVTAALNNIFPARLLEIGVHGYFTKDTGQEELIKAIKSVRTGKRIIASQIANQLAVAKATGQSSNIFDALSNREMEVFLMTLGGIEIKGIANSLHLSPKTVSTYRLNIFKKLKINTDAELVLLAIKNKIIDSETIEEVV